jgi:hypothetical protein
MNNILWACVALFVFSLGMLGGFLHGYAVRKIKKSILTGRKPADKLEE